MTASIHAVVDRRALESDSTALNQTRRSSLLSKIWSENRYPLFGIMLEKPGLLACGFLAPHGRRTPATDEMSRCGSPQT
jgi:hypothetical protein